MKRALSVLLVAAMLIALFAIVPVTADAAGYQGTINMKVGDTRTVFAATGTVVPTRISWYVKGGSKYVEVVSTSVYSCQIKAKDYNYEGPETLECIVYYYDNLGRSANYTNTYTIEIQRPIFTISFDANGGSVSTSSKSVLHSDSIGTMPTPTRKGYRFLGWYTSAESGSEVKTSEYAVKDMTLYAHWIKDVTYTVKFDVNGGKGTANSKKVKNGNTIGKLPTPKRSGYYLAGWYTSKSGGKKVSTSYVVSKSITLYAHWLKDVNYTVKFDPNGGKVSPTSRSVKNGKKVGTLPKPTRSGYFFKGWYTGKSGGKKVTKSTVISKKTVLYARWTLGNSKITFDALGGTVSPNKVTIKTGGSVDSLPEPEREGYTFLGWYLSDAEESKVTTDTIFKGNTTVYARWSGKWKNYTVIFGRKTATIEKYNGSSSKLTIPSTIDDHTVTAIGSCAFEYCSSLQSVTVPKTVTLIDYFAFYKCYYLTNVKLNDGLKTIRNGTFSGCQSLTSITIPDTVTEIGNQAFYECSGLQEIKFGNQLKKIGAQLCFACRNLSSVTIPKSVTEIGNQAFGYYSVYTEGYDYGYWTTLKISGFTINGYSGSAALTYASDNGFYSNVLKETKTLVKITKLENVSKGTKLTWKKLKNAAKYKVFVKNGSSWKRIATVNSNTYTYTKVKSGTKYTYTVRAVDKQGKYISDYGKKGYSCTFYSAPALDRVESYNDRVEFVWYLVDGVKNYRVFRKVNGGSWKKFMDTDSPKYNCIIDYDLKKGNTYSYTVRCLTADGKKYISGYDTKGITFKYNGKNKWYY